MPIAARRYPGQESLECSGARAIRQSQSAPSGTRLWDCASAPATIPHGNGTAEWPRKVAPVHRAKTTVSHPASGILPKFVAHFPGTRRCRVDGCDDVHLHLVFLHAKQCTFGRAFLGSYALAQGSDIFLAAVCQFAGTEEC